jgi:hypothetical protein
MIFKFPYIIAIASFLILLSCENSDDTFIDSEVETNESDVSDIVVSEELMEGLIQSITSPVEMANLIRTTGGAFNSKIMSETNNLDRFSSSHDQALNLGVFVADLGYVNIYEKSIYAIEYLNSIKFLADELMVGQFFDYETLKRLASNSQNVDSLLYISTNSFNEMDLFLRSQKRSELSVLIITGAWLEGLYISTQVALEGENQELFERIGEQKINLEGIKGSIEAYSSKAYFKDMSAKFEKLVQVYEGVTITYEYGDPEAIEVDGQLVIVDNSSSKVDITDKQIKEIAQIVNELRNKIVKSN